MFTTTFRAIAGKMSGTVIRSGAVCLVLIGLSSSPAAAGTLLGEVTSTVNSTLSLCPGQTFSQPFAAIGDYNSYTLVPGSEFNNPPEGWELRGGAHVVPATLPNGATGAALDLPSGSVAVSAPVCVTLGYPAARVYTNSLEGRSGVTVSVSYPETKSESKPKQVATIVGTKAGWEASEAFNVLPQLAGKEQGTREVRFIFAAGGSSTDTLLFGLYVDPYAK